MRTISIAGVIVALAAGSALAQGVGTPPKPAVAAKPPVATKDGATKARRSSAKTADGD